MKSDNATKAWDEYAPDLDAGRWTLADCEREMHDVRRFRLAHVPADSASFLQTRDLVPYSQKTLDRMTKSLLSASPEYAPRAHGVADFRYMDLRQRFPANGVQRTRQSPCLPFESGPNTLPGMEVFK